MKYERNYGIDFLRVLSMIFIVILHSLGQGGILYNATLLSPQYKVSWLLECYAYCAVDIFALISGYVSYKGQYEKIKYSNYINLWFQVLFYMIFSVWFYMIFRSTEININDFINMFFPISGGVYWYFVAYTGLIVIMPLLNKAIVSFDKKFLCKLFVIFFLLFSVFDTFFLKFNLQRGYSFIWIVLLYIMGAIIKKCEIGKKISTLKSLIIIVVLGLITYLYKMYGFEFQLFNTQITKHLLISYTSPTILGMALLYIIGFSKVKFNSLIIKVIKFCAPSTFAIYLLNTEPHIWNFLMKDLFLNLVDRSVLKILIFIISFSCAFCLISIFIDKVRIFIFRVYELDSISKKIELKLKKIFNLIVSKI